MARRAPPPDGMWVKIPVAPETAARASEHVERVANIVDLGRSLLGAVTECVAALDRELRQAERTAAVKRTRKRLSKRAR